MKILLKYDIKKSHILTNALFGNILTSCFTMGISYKNRKAIYH